MRRLKIAVIALSAAILVLGGVLVWPTGPLGIVGDAAASNCAEGDLNHPEAVPPPGGDGALNILDVYVVAKGALLPTYTWYQHPAYDISPAGGDGAVNILDVFHEAVMALLPPSQGGCP